MCRLWLGSRSCTFIGTFWCYQPVAYWVSPYWRLCWSVWLITESTAHFLSIFLQNLFSLWSFSCCWLCTLFCIRQQQQQQHHEEPWEKKVSHGTVRENMMKDARLWTVVKPRKPETLISSRISHRLHSLRQKTGQKLQRGNPPVSLCVCLSVWADDGHVTVQLRDGGGDELKFVLMQHLNSETNINLEKSWKKSDDVQSYVRGDRYQTYLSLNNQKMKKLFCWCICAVMIGRSCSGWSKHQHFSLFTPGSAVAVA